MAVATDDDIDAAAARVRMCVAAVRAAENDVAEKIAARDVAALALQAARDRLQTARTVLGGERAALRDVLNQA